MKKVLLLAVVALFVMMPLASFAMTTISDSDLNAITAQEGVSIYLDNVTLTGMNLTMSWGQSSNSSLLANSSTGQVTLDTAGNLVGQKIANFGFDQGGFVGAAISVGQIQVNGLLTIDVGVNNGSILTTSTASTYANAYGNSTSGAAGLPGGIQLGLHNMAISVGAPGAMGVQMIIKVGAEETLAGTTTANLITSSTSSATTAFIVPSWMTMGTAYVGALNTTVNGNVFISTH